MISRKERIRSTRQKKNFRRIIQSALFSTSLFSLFGITFAFGPDTFAWFSSETEATGTIQNATTSDLLSIQTSEIQYGENCSLSQSVSIDNISDIETTIRISLVTEDGEHQLINQPVNPGQSIQTDPDSITPLVNDCKTDRITYKIRAFQNFVDETRSTAVDKKQLQEPLPQVEDDGKDDTQDPPNQDAGQNENEQQSPEKDVGQNEQQNPEQNTDQDNPKNSEQESGQNEEKHPSQDVDNPVNQPTDPITEGEDEQKEAEVKHGESESPHN